MIYTLQNDEYLKVAQIMIYILQNRLIFKSSSNYDSRIFCARR